MTARVEIYRDEAEEWRFRRIAVNGEVIATGEGYKNQVDAARMARQLFPGLTIYLIDDQPLPPPD